MLTTEVLERVVRAATRAPSVHNTQPWTVEVGLSRGRGMVDVRVDPARSLRHGDPLSREATISCGALVDHLVVAARREGLDAEVTVTAGDGDLRLARVSLSPGDLPSVAELELSVATVHRRTTRIALDDLVVDDALVARLVRMVADAQAHLVVLPPGSAARGVVLRQVARAEALATEDLVGRAEEEAWTGRAAAADGAGDGVPVEEPWAGHPGAAPGPGSRRLSDRAGPGDATEHGAVLALLTTPGDSPDDWLRAGRALSRLLLEATVAGLTASFATTVLENPTTRHEVVRSLGLVGAPQVLLQLGYGEPGVRTPRRALGTAAVRGDHLETGGASTA
ncbi:nitroreductase family protein [Sanguibacter keddieii DSM 10542]|uniref:Nitroreductase family protein n=1 Tax=Sanguibacter keddieii (strain ATCC 51767 / DSM 10542 / NCFB 3025 / ST-74) TaxID=446469 RepID=D1BHA5_SANKS|nr:nitroreductase [Sanguibacter keddieii]ACZ21825.1 nitroreductase family protein [Sanguibacter keddieii DSM 10542]